MAQYDPTILQKFADKMYLRAYSLIAVYTVFGLILGCLVGALIPSFSRGSDAWTIGPILGVIGAVLGFIMGVEKAFWLKMEAQKALCQLQIELNTRPQENISAKK